MKILILLVLLVSTQSTFAQDMSRTETVKQAYKHMPNGSTRYIGKCLTHEDKKKSYTVTKLIQKGLEVEDMTTAEVKAFIRVIGQESFKFMMKEYFGDVEEFKSLSQMIRGFKEYCDDITVEEIQLRGSNKATFTRFNVGYGGGNGGYLVVLNDHGKLKKMSLTGDGDLRYCDKMVWK